jgi:5-methylcytosine-specific restriction enzyme A
MNRKTFMLKQGATCANWTWSWSFINSRRKAIYFGAWDKNTEGNTSLIFDKEWEYGTSGRKNSAYEESLRHIHLVEKGYKLYTFPIIYSSELKNSKGIGPAKIKRIIPILTSRKLIKIGSMWYAKSKEMANRVPEEIENSEGVIEGVKKTIIINTYERNKKAREICIKHYGLSCTVCGFNFQAKYGDIGAGIIHVHHLIPLASITGSYVLNPIKDLRPICPNCHALIHSTNPILTIKQLRSLIG